MKTKLRTPQFLALFACLGFALAPLGCAKDPADGGDGDGDATGDGDGDTGDSDTGLTDPGDGDGDGTGDGDGDDTFTGDGDGEPPCDGDLPDGSTCTSDCECLSVNCYVVPFLGGQCGACNEDIDCPDGGCTPPNPFESNGPTCNMGEPGAGCETDEVCQDGLVCGTILDLLGLIQINTCGECASDADCGDGLICAPIVSVEDFNGQATCIEPGTQPQDAYCDLEGTGDMACESGICSTVDVMGLAEVGACGECNTDDDCNGGTCTLGGLDLEAGALVGSTCA